MSFSLYQRLCTAMLLCGFALIPWHSVTSNHQVSRCVQIETWGLNAVSDFDACALKNIYQIQASQFPKLPRITGFKAYSEYDDAIQFWISFWNQRGYTIPVGDPLIIKALIAVESSFETKAKAYDPRSSAYGLTQITNQTRTILSGVSNKRGFKEIRSDRLHLSREDLEDPIISIAAGVRWIAHKYEKLPKHKKHFVYALKSYHSWDEAGQDYADKVSLLYSHTRLNESITQFDLFSKNVSNPSPSQKVLKRSPAHSVSRRYNKK